MQNSRLVLGNLRPGHQAPWT